MFNNHIPLYAMRKCPPLIICNYM